MVIEWDLTMKMVDLTRLTMKTGGSTLHVNNDE
jgi:hypothetical protein